MKTKSKISVKNKNYEYTLEKKAKNTIRLVCKSANIDQNFLAEDIPNVIMDLPNLIISEQKYKSKKDTFIRFRVNSDEKQKIEKKAIAQGYSSTSAFLKELILK